MKTCINAQGLQTIALVYKIFIKKAKDANVEYQQESTLLTGKDFLDVIEPGLKLGEVVKKVYELQLDGLIDKDELKKEVLAFFE